MHVGTDDPRLNTAGDIDFRLSRIISAWKKEDPPPNRVKPVPIQVIRRIAFLAQSTADQHYIAIADMIIIGFFFLLRPGEYTDSSSESTPFRLADVQLFIGQTRLNILEAPIQQLQQAQFATLEFTDQKNGVRGEIIGLGRSGDPYLCPVLSIIRRVLYLRSHNVHPHSPLVRVMNTPSRVTAASITKVLRDCVTYLGADLGFLPSDVSARSLRASGATALLLGKVDTDIIRLIGRWRSDEMLRYLHIQAAPLMQNYSRIMLNAGQYNLLPNHLVPCH